MPGYDRFWLDDGQRRAPIAPEARQTDPQQAVARGQFWALSCRPVEHADLMAQSQVLEPEGSTRPEDRGPRCEECREKNEHRRELCRKTNSHALKHFEIFERHRPRPHRSSVRLAAARRSPFNCHDCWMLIKCSSARAACWLSVLPNSARPAPTILLSAKCFAQTSFKSGF